jgi:ubiquinone/menaquinone biosynthesis C-methylase UbiE
MTTPEPLRAQKAAVPTAFDHVAARYDLLTGLNPGYKKHLRWSAERLWLPDGPAEVLDLCCGTGLSTEALVAAYPQARVTALDASPGMLAVAGRKPWASRVRWVCGDAMDPAASGVGGPFDGALMAYGIRNMPDPDLCLRRILALLRPGGAVCFHEYSVRDSTWSRAVWNAVALGIIIPAGLVTSPRSDIYRYLRNSVNAFDGVAAFKARLARAGFVDVRSATMDGWQAGVVHSFLARRPA